MSDASEFDPFRGGGRDDFPLLRKLRAEGPVATVAGGMTYVTQHDACRAVLRDTDAFSNASGMKAPGVVIPFEDRILGELDPPEHSRVRRVMVTALTPKVVHDAEPFMRTTADALLAALARARARRARSTSSRATRCRCPTASPSTCSGSRPRTPTTSRAWRRS